jgi:hypothetical protein
MTEAEWLACDDVNELLDLARKSDRKARLFACGCCRQIERLLKYDENLRAVEVSELYADGLAKPAGLRAAARKAKEVASSLRFEAEVAMKLSLYATKDAAEAAALAAEVRLNVSRVAHYCWTAVSATAGKRPNQPALVRDIFGNPFRPVAPDPRWLTSTAVALADGIYADRAFDRLPILADALEEAGCDDADVLAHCRSDGPHARGCWVVDLVLGKS